LITWQRNYSNALFVWANKAGKGFVTALFVDQSVHRCHEKEDDDKDTNTSVTVGGTDNSVANDRPCCVDEKQEIGLED